MRAQRILNTEALIIIEKYYYSIFTAIVFVLSLLTNWYIPLAIFITCLTVIKVLYKLGKGIVLRELIALHMIFICVFMPVFGYLVYNYDNALVRLWLRFMLVPQDEYFDFVIPATAAFAAALCWPIASAKASDEGEGLRNMIAGLKVKLQKTPNIGLPIMVIGIGFFFVGNFLPTAFQFLTTLFFWGAFAGILYVYYSENCWQRKLVLIGFGFLIVLNAIQSGMFTILAYMGITMFSFFFLSTKTKFWKKLLGFGVSVCLLIVIQDIKMEFRKATWTENYQGSKMSLFAELIVDRAGNMSELFSEKAFFPIYYRANQGFNITLVMRRFPEVQPYDGGGKLAIVFASSLVPRLLWPDKPEAGGRANMKYYTGITIRSWSTNVGPLGEAYGSFGPRGAIVFMFALGALIRWAYRILFTLSRRMPFMVFWLPVVFYQITYSSESDTLQILNSLFKSAFFVWVLTKVVPGWFGIKKKGLTRPVPRSLVPAAPPNQ